MLGNMTYLYGILRNVFVNKFKKMDTKLVEPDLDPHNLKSRIRTSIEKTDRIPVLPETICSPQGLKATQFTCL